MKKNLYKYLAGNEYPGRGIVLGLTPDSKKAVVAYWIMGRSANSRNRVFEPIEGGIRTVAADPAKLEDPHSMPNGYILPGLCNSALMCLSGLFGDFAIIKIIASSQFETAQSYLYRNRAQDTQELSAAVVILLLITLLINYLVHKSQDPADRVS